MNTGWKRQGFKYVLNNTQDYYAINKRFTVRSKAYFGFFSYWLLYLVRGPAWLKDQAEELRAKSESFILDKMMDDEELEMVKAEV